MKEKEIIIKMVPGGWNTKVGTTKTGTWRTFRPIVDINACTGCKTCEMFCPENTIIVIEELAQVDYDYCKGCGICANECPLDAITVEPEVGYSRGGEEKK